MLLLDHRDTAAAAGDHNLVCIRECLDKLASDLKADELLILTSVDYVYLNFEKENQEPLKWRF